MTFINLSQDFLSAHSKKDRPQNNQPQSFRGPNNYSGPPRSYDPGYNGQTNPTFMTEPDFVGSQRFMRSGTQYDRQLSFNGSVHSSYESGNNYSNCSSTFNDGDYVEPRRAFGQTAP